MSTDTVNKDVPPQENPAAIADGWADAYTPEINVYEPHRTQIPPLGPYVRELWRRREFAVEMSRMRLRSQHYGTMFGTAWLILSPLMLGVVYFVLVDIIRGGNRPEGFFTHLLAGVFAYYLFSDAVRPAARSVVGGGRLILNTAFPRALLPLSAVIVSIMRFLPTLPVYAILHVATGRPIGPEMLWALAVFAEIVVFAAGVSMLVAALQVYFRDLKEFLPYLMRVWLYLSPVLWYADEVPHDYDFLLYVNPLGSMLTAWSEALNSATTPGLEWMLVGLAWALGALVAGGLFFVSREREFAVRL
jgi:ABC-type polysaccharide/polyol phosphate export permease